MTPEAKYQSGLIKRIKAMFPGCIVLKNDSGYLQGFPDLTILYEDKWAVLEVKPREDADAQPNQHYYVDRLGGMSYAAFIYPENEEEILCGLQEAFRTRRKARVP